MGYMTSSTPAGMFFVSPDTIGNNTSHHTWTELRAILRVAQKKGYLPRRLVITEDNTCKENKSHERMLSLAFLVHLDIFESVEVRYFKVGHTHWKMDQVFSVLSKAILAALLGYACVFGGFSGCDVFVVSRSVLSPEMLERIILESWHYNENPSNQNEYFFYAMFPRFKYWMKNSGVFGKPSSHQYEIPEISKYRYFLFQKDHKDVKVSLSSSFFTQKEHDNMQKQPTYS